jgi:hypothetical protein
MSKLEDLSISFRKENIAKNRYSNNNQYTVSHENALSTGDELGKGEVNGSVGSATDIKSRETLVTKNKYSKSKEYNAGTA